MYVLQLCLVYEIGLFLLYYLNFHLIALNVDSPAICIINVLPYFTQITPITHLEKQTSLKAAHESKAQAIL
jgi:hypothetical protein